MDLIRTRLDNVVPNGRNPRSDFSSVDRLAGNLAATGGEPINPIVAMRDGGKYRIVDGERRWRAMRAIGTEECTVAVVEDWDEADEIMGALATDDKEPLSAVERSRGLQEFLDLGIEDESRTVAAEKVAGFEAGVSKRIRRARKAAGEKSMTMSIEQLIAAEEFADDEDAMMRIIDAGVGSWRTTYTNEKYRMKKAKIVASLSEILEKHGVTGFRERPEEFEDHYVRKVWGGADDLENLLASAEDLSDFKFYLNESFGQVEYVSLSDDRGAAREEPVRDEKRRAVEEAAFSVQDEAFSWLYDNFIAVGRIPAALDLDTGAEYRKVSDFVDGYLSRNEGRALDLPATWVDVAGWVRRKLSPFLIFRATAFVYAAGVAMWVAAFDELTASGFVPSDKAKAAREEISALAAGREKAE